MKTLFTFSLLLVSLISIAQTRPDVERAEESVVLVKLFDYYGNYLGHGSGFVIDPSGIVVTNYHVVEGAYSMKVVFRNKYGDQTYDISQIISGSESLDLAKIRIKNPSNKTFAFLKVNKTIPRKTDPCWAIGTPADPIYMNTVSDGTISNIYHAGIGDWKGTMFQVTAPFSSGSSGGALINSKNEVIGITCGGRGDADGARANINLAIAAKELDNLSPINKQRIVSETVVPSQISFYTNSPYTGDVYLYIDNVYVGKFDKYFQNNYEPDCGVDGTITRYLYPGEHTIYVYWSSSQVYYNGKITLASGQCQKIPISPVSNNSYGGLDFPNISFTGRKIEDRGPYMWTVYSGFSFVETGRGRPFPIFVEKLLPSKKYSIRGNIQFVNRKADPSAGYDFDNKYFGIGLDYKRIFFRPHRWNYFLAGTLNYREYSIKYNQDNNYLYSYNQDKEQNHVFIGARLGGDRYTTERFYITWDWGLGYHTAYRRFASDGNILVGYRFNL